MKKFLLPMVLMLSGWTGFVSEVYDGNFVSVLNLETQQTVVVRLWASDAPEIDQPFGFEAKNFLQDLVIAKEVNIEDVHQDLSGLRYVKLFLGEIYVNLELVKHGYAWVDQPIQSQDILLTTFEEACSLGIGLWSDKQSVNPRVWRKTHGIPSRKIDAISMVKNLDIMAHSDPDRVISRPKKSKSEPYLSSANKINNS